MFLSNIRLQETDSTKYQELKNFWCPHYKSINGIYSLAYITRTLKYPTFVEAVEDFLTHEYADQISVFIGRGQREKYYARWFKNKTLTTARNIRKIAQAAERSHSPIGNLEFFFRDPMYLLKNGQSSQSPIQNIPRTGLNISRRGDNIFVVGLSISPDQINFFPEYKGAWRGGITYALALPEIICN